MAELAVFLGVAAVLAVVAIRFGILIGNRLARVVDRDEEEPSEPAP